MKDFISSALPLILAGIGLALLAVNFSKKKDENQGRHIAMGAGFGLLLGVTLNQCGLWENHIWGIVLGLLWGMALGAAYRGKDPKEE